MGFLLWHYSKGLEYYIKAWLGNVDSLITYFSPLTLLTSLFSPWKRLIVADDSPGFNITRFFEVLSYNMISRVIGAIVRLILLVVWVIMFFVTGIFGVAGLFVWICLPFVGIPSYLFDKRLPENSINSLVGKIQKSPGRRMKTFLESTEGKFLLGKLMLTKDELVENSVDEEKFPVDLSTRNFEEFVTRLMSIHPFKDEFLRSKSLTADDFILAAKWWDKIKTDELEIKRRGRGKPGIGLELLFGYTPNLNQYATDMGVKKSFSHHLIGRQQVVSRIERVLSAGSSVVLIGQPGVGKKTVIYEFAHRASQGLLGAKMSYRRIVELDYSFLLSEATDLDQKKSKLKQILAEAAYAGNIILVIRDLHKLTNSQLEGYDFTDIFEKYLEKGDLKIIAVSTPVDYERFFSKNMRLRKFMDVVEITQPTLDEAKLIVIEAATNWERTKNVNIPVQTVKAILDGSDRYVTETPFPEKALELLDAVVIYREQEGGATVTPDDVNIVLSEKTGISFAALTSKEKEKLGNLEGIIHERLVNQEIAVSLIARSLRSRVSGVSKENRPVGSFLFLGPTGVGKTETAKVLAKVYYGAEDQVLRFDMAEYAGREGLERLIGSQDNNSPGALTTAIKNRPASLLLLDEIEKAPREIYNLFLTLLDEGVMTDAGGRKIIGKHLFIIATSNASAEYIRQLVSQGVKGEELQKQVVNKVLEDGIFSPEFLNRFDGVVVYEPLTNEHLVKVAGHLLTEMVENLKKKNITMQVTREATEKLAKEGFDPAFGARPMRRIVDLVLGDLIGKAILAGEVNPGDNIKLVPMQGRDEYKLE